MKKYKNLFFYLALTGAFSFFIYWIIIQGKYLENGRQINLPLSENNTFDTFLSSLTYNLEHPLAILLAQIIMIIMVARIFGYLCKKIGQPTVVGEIAAGIFLGPSLVGLYFPEFSAALFPLESLGNLQFLSQIGLILFMFVIGMELDLKILRNKAHDAVIISHASIIIPFALGIGLAYYVYQSFAPDGVMFSSFSLFMGIAMSITAFPVLARIVQERGLNKTKLGTIVITCAAADDITAWCILAAVIAIVKAGSFLSALYTMMLAVAYVFLMLKMVRPFLKRVGDLHTSRENLSKPVVAIFFLTLIISSWATEVIGIHALFGAFMAGAIMPENMKFRNLFIEKVEDVALVLLLPLFFVFTGLRTEIGLLNDPYLWKVCGLIILVAVTGKFVGGALAAKFVGQNWKDSLSIGALMNTRGLMELVVLNIGYDLGILTGEIFAMMVIMALVTTVMTGPSLDIINWAFRKQKEVTETEMATAVKYNVLLSFGNSDTGKSLLLLAHSLVKKQNNETSVTAMHLTPSSELNHYNAEVYEKESFGPIIQESERLNQNVTTLFKATINIESDIIEVANKGNYDLLLIGSGSSIFEGSLLGKVFGFTTRIVNPTSIINKVTGKEKLFSSTPFEDTTKSVLLNSHIPVGILMDKGKGLTAINTVFVFMFDEKDAFLLTYAKRLAVNGDVRVQLLDASGSDSVEYKNKVTALSKELPGQVKLLNHKTLSKESLKNQDLMLVSLDSWSKLVDSQSVFLNDRPATLIIRESRDS
jgi:Kef-type K+ transport system membrane component KefB